MELLFFIGICYAISQAWGASTTAVGNARQSARTRATARGGHYNTQGTARRAARQATIGWWLGEIRHRFPVTRAGFTHGWAQHQHVMRERERDAARRDASHAHTWADWREEIAAYRHRIEVARKRGQQPDMTQQLDAERRQMPPAGTKPAQPEDPPLADGSTPGRPLEWDDLEFEEAYGNGQQGPQPSGNGSGGSGMAGDINYDQTIRLCDQLVDAAEHAVNDAALADATNLADELGGSLRNDSTTVGMAAEVAEAIAAVQAANKQLQDAAAGLKDRVQTNYGPTQEAVDASDADAPEPQFLDH